MEVALAIAGLATAYCAVPFAHVGKALRTSPFSTIGMLALLGVLIFTSYRDNWTSMQYDPELGMGELTNVLVQMGIGIAAYLLLSRVRQPFAGSWLPETLGVLVLAYAAAMISPAAAAVLVNVWLLLLGIQAVRGGLEQDSLSRMNLGLAIISGTIALRFFDLDINDALKGVVFIALGIGFLVMNLRLIAQRKKHGHA